MFGFGKPSKKEFVEKLADEFKRLGFIPDYNPESFEFHIRPSDRGEQVAHLRLENVYQNYRNAKKSERGTVIASVADFIRKAIAGEPPPAWSEAKSLLMPRLTSRGTLEEQRLTRPPDPHRLLTDNVAECLALDYPDRIEYVTERHLDFWKQTFEQAEKVARDNLWARSNEPLRQIAPGGYVGDWNDQYDAARILLQPLLLNLGLRGDLVAWIPARGTLLVSGTEELAGLQAIVRAMDKVDRSYPLSLTPFRLRGETWEPLELPGDHALAAIVREAVVQDRFEDYEEQSQHLQEHFQATGVDVYVGDLICTRRKSDQAMFLVAVWPNGLETLIPEADRVVLATESTPVERDLSWEEFISEYSGRLELTDYWPRRWKGCHWK